METTATATADVFTELLYQQSLTNEYIYFGFALSLSILVVVLWYKILMKGV